MPRRNPARTVPFEAHVAVNMSRERERLGLTYERLAERMTERGCPIQPSALHKMEKGDPPRRITVNELMVLADVLGVKAFDLVDDPDRSMPQEIWSAVQNVEALEERIIMRHAQIDDDRRHIANIVQEIATLIGNDNRTRAALRRYLAEGWPHWPAFRKNFQPALTSRKADAR